MKDLVQKSGIKICNFFLLSGPVDTFVRRITGLNTKRYKTLIAFFLSYEPEKCRQAFKRVSNRAHNS